jgi:hypothetical protein
VLARIGYFKKKKKKRKNGLQGNSQKENRK